VLHTSTHTISDTSSVSEDKPILIVPIHFAKPENNHTYYDVLMLEASENIIQPETQPINSTKIVLTFYDNTIAMDLSSSDIPEAAIIKIQTT
jgi:hypothetical protein